MHTADISAFAWGLIIWFLTVLTAGALKNIKHEKRIRGENHGKEL